MKNIEDLNAEQVVELRKERQLYELSNSEMRKNIERIEKNNLKIQESILEVKAILDKAKKTGIDAQTKILIARRSLENTKQFIEFLKSRSDVLRGIVGKLCTMHFVRNKLSN